MGWTDRMWNMDGHADIRDENINHLRSRTMGCSQRFKNETFSSIVTAVEI